MNRFAISLALALLVSICSYAQKLDNKLRAHVEFLSSDAMMGRKAGSEGEKKAAEYLYDKLSKVGVTMLTPRQGNTFRIVSGQDTIVSRNVVGILEGYDPELRDEYILIGAHIDHLGTYSLTVNGQKTTNVYSGADANASGVAALIEVADMLSQNLLFLRRSIILVGFGAGEEEYGGSRYFATGGEFPYINNVKLVMNLDRLGRGDKNNPFELYTIIKKNTLNPLLEYLKENESVTVLPALHSGEIFPSDHLAFTQLKIPSITFSTGISNEYRTNRDVSSLIMYDNLAAEVIYITAFAKSAACKDILFPAETIQIASADGVYSASDCDKRPQFFHSDESHFLNSWVYKYLKYPEDAIDKGIQGRVIVSFIIEKDGSVTNVKIEQGVYESLDEEALKVVSISPKWIPGEIGRKKVRTKIALPVEFRLKARR
ncbi:MAG: TonB family protein [Bacteroidales bacterium]|nr:TonB family protein [Bacteroidales bacterium]